MLEALSIARIDYAFEGDVGKSYKQTFNPAITYASIPNKTVDSEPPPPGPLDPIDPTPDKNSGGGCDVGFGMVRVFGLAAAWVLRKR